MSSSDDSDSSSDFEDVAVLFQADNISDAAVVNEQWVKLIEYCSCGSNFQEAVIKSSGVQKLCQATDVHFGEKDPVDNGWIISNNNQEECLIVSFQTPIFINEIHIYESLNPGSIVKLQMMESQRNKWWTMWQRKPHRENKSRANHIFKPILRRYHLQSNTIRITIDPRYADRIGIQAIKLIGSNIFDANLHRTTLPQAMIRLYQQILDNTNGDVQFLIDDKLINAHRNILCCRSAYFRALLLDEFSEKNQIKPIELTDIDYETFVEILFYLYTGAYHQTISYAIAIKCMIYSNKIDFLTGKNAALEQLGRHLSSDHDLILSLYCRIKQMSPAFDLLLDYIYHLCSHYMNEICKQKEFLELDKDLMIDLICQSAERREIREQEKNKQATIIRTNLDEE